MTDRCLNLYPAQLGPDGWKVEQEIAKTVQLTYKRDSYDRSEKADRRRK